MALQHFKLFKSKVGTSWFKNMKIFFDQLRIEYYY
jgi:hypothetical protein